MSAIFSGKAFVAAYPSYSTASKDSATLRGPPFVSRGCFDQTIRWRRFMGNPPTLRMSSPISGLHAFRRATKSGGTPTLGVTRKQNSSGTKSGPTRIGFAIAL